MQSLRSVDNILQHFSRSPIASRAGGFSGSDAKRRGSVWSAIWRGARSEMVLNNTRIASLYVGYQKMMSVMTKVLALFRQNHPG